MRILWFAVLFLTIPAAVLAYDVGDSQVFIHGFVSQGYIDSSGNNFLADTKDGTTEFNEIGLMVTSPVNDKLRVGLQLLSRDLGDVGNNDVMLDWAYGDYRLADYLGIRLGKIKMPMGFYNEERDSDFMRPTIFLPQSIYREGNRDLFVAYQGAGVYGNIFMQGGGDLDYHLFYGNVTIPDNSDMLRELFHVAEMHLMKVDMMAATNGRGVSEAGLSNDYVYGGSLIYNTPLEGLRLGATIFDLKSDISIEQADGTVSQGLAHMKNRWVASLEYDHPLFTVTGEYSEYDFERVFFGQKVPGGTSMAWYAMLAVPLCEQWTLTSVYDVFYPDKDDKNGTTFVDGSLGMPMKDFEGFRKDLSFGLHWDINPNWTVKGEYHLVGGVFPSSTLYNSLQDLKEDWNYLALKTSFNF